MKPDCTVLKAHYDADLIAERVRPHLPEGDYRHILIKPNWVLHEESARFPIEALVTHPTVIEGVLEACLDRYPTAEWIVVGDVPLQSCQWDALRRQAGIAELARRYAKNDRPSISFLDLRRERFRSRRGYLVREHAEGDPRGYHEVVLDEDSFLDPISRESSQFRVSDFDPTEVQSSHRKGYHRYLISGSVLAADLLVNLPKMKTHQKSGVTGALKNLVGINGHKGYLAHHRKGTPEQGGDEFPADVSRLFVLQARVRSALQKRSRLLFMLGRAAWTLLKHIYRIETEGVPAGTGKRTFIAGGSWHGNDTVWRMIYDLNRIVRYAPSDGGYLRSDVQRSYVAVLDAIVAGEGNGPLQPEPVDVGLIAVSSDPFVVDVLMAQLMGFDPERIPMLAERHAFGGEWGRVAKEDLRVAYLGTEIQGLDGIPSAKQFRAPPGWTGHIERGTSG